VFAIAVLLLLLQIRQGLRGTGLRDLFTRRRCGCGHPGNKFGFYGHPFGPLRDYDEFAHFAGSGFSALAAFWCCEAATRRMGLQAFRTVRLLGFCATSVAFNYAAVRDSRTMDELFYSHFERIHSWDDTPNDLFYDFLGVIFFVAFAALVFLIKGARRKATPTTH